MANTEIIDKPVHFIQCQCSVAHTFGNVTAFIQNWLINLFPKDFFKTIHINSKLASLQLKSTPQAFLKKQSPMFIIRPRVEWNDTSKFLYGTPITERQFDLYSSRGFTNLQEFYFDTRKKMALKYQLNRHSMTFDVILVFRNYMTQLNWANFLVNSIRFETPFMLPTCLESYIDKSLLEKISKYADIPLIDSDGTNATFLKYMNSNSIHPVTYKLQGSSGNDEYYRYYPANIEATPTGLSVDEGTQEGQMTGKYQISFSIKVEFFATGFYFLFSDKIKKDTTLNVKYNEYIIPVFTDVLTVDDINLPMGWQLYSQNSCMLDKPDDEIDINLLINNSTKKAIDYHIKRGIPTMEFFKIRIRKQGMMLEYGKDYILDLENMKIKFINQSTFYTYKLLVMLNIEYINNLVKAVYNLK